MSESVSIDWVQGRPNSNILELENLASEISEGIFRRAGVSANEAWTEYCRQSEVAKGLPVYTYSGLALVWREAEFEAQCAVQDQLWGSDEVPLISLRLAGERA